LGKGKLTDAEFKAAMQNMTREGKKKFNSINIAIGASGLHAAQINQEPFKRAQNVDPSQWRKKKVV
jgi:predicted DNA binding CopG/RHH family protein